MKYLRRNKICFPPQAQFSRYLESVFVFVCVVCYFILYLYFIYPPHIYRHTLLLHIYPSPLWTLLHLHPLYILLPFFLFLYCVCLPCCKITKRLLFFKVRNFVVKRFVVSGYDCSVCCCYLKFHFFSSFKFLFIFCFVAYLSVEKTCCGGLWSASCTSQSLGEFCFSWFEIVYCVLQNLSLSRLLCIEEKQNFADFLFSLLGFWLCWGDLSTIRG